MTSAAYPEILELYDYCVIRLKINARLQPLYDGYQILFPNDDDFVQHCYSYGSNIGCVEPQIGCKLDYTAVSLEKAKRLVRRHRRRLMKRRRGDEIVTS